MNESSTTARVKRFVASREAICIAVQRPAHEKARHPFEGWRAGSVGRPFGRDQSCCGA